MFLCPRKLVHLEKTHMHTGKMCKLGTKCPQENKLELDNLVFVGHQSNDSLIPFTFKLAIKSCMCLLSFECIHVCLVKFFLFACFALL